MGKTPTDELIDSYRNLIDHHREMTLKLAGIVGRLMGAMDSIVIHPDRALKIAIENKNEIQEELDNLYKKDNEK